MSTKIGTNPLLAQQQAEEARKRREAAEAQKQAALAKAQGHSTQSTMSRSVKPQKTEAATTPTDVSKMNETQKYNYYKSLIEKVGPFDPSKPQVLGLRVPTRPDSAQSGKFDDVLVVLKGGKVYEFQANTEPAGRYSTRRADLGQLAPNQQITYRPFFNDPKFGNGFEPVGDPAVQRYDNGIGGQLGGVRRDGGGSSMLFHTSFSDGDTGSMGCQTMRPADMEKFNQVLGGQPFTYTLLETGANGVPNVNSSNAEHYDGALSEAQMRQAFPTASDAQIKAHTPFVNQILKDMNADTPQKASAILATISVETGDLKWLEELGRPAEHGGYHGRGYIHLTHKESYARASQDLFGDNRLVDNPDLAARPDVAAKLFTWYCKKENPSAYQAIQAGDIKATSAAINTGDPNKWSITNGKAERLAAYDRAMSALSGGFAGGYVANGNTPVDTSTMYSGDGRSSVSGAYQPSNGYAGSASSWYDSSSRMPFAQDATIDPARIASPYAGTPGTQSHSDFMDLFMSLLWSDSDWSALVDSPEFEEWMKTQAFGRNWKRGDPVPKELMAKFLAEKLSAQMKEKQKSEGSSTSAESALSEQNKKDILRELKAQYSVRKGTEVAQEGAWADLTRNFQPNVVASDPDAGFAPLIHSITSKLPSL
jgi:predicted chitinase